MTLLALGDSYTIGEGVPAEQSWPAQLARRLAESGVPAHARIIARTGWTTDELAAAIGRAKPRGPFGLVTLLVGVNDQYRGLDRAGFEQRFGALVIRAIALAGRRPGHVLVVSIPDWGVTAFAHDRDRAAIAADIDAFNAAAHAIAARARVHWVDVTGLSRVAGDAPEQLAADGLHPSARQYETWVDHLFPEALAAIRTPASPR